MFVDWLNFRVCLGDLADSIVYVDNEGREIPLACECKFEKAIKLAKLNNNTLKLVLYLNESEANIKNQRKRPFADPLNESVKTSELRTVNMDIISKEKCQMNSDLPDWFVCYMKRFKRKLLTELKSDLNDVSQHAGEKEKEMLNQKKEGTHSSCRKMETDLNAGATEKNNHNNKKIKMKSRTVKHKVLKNTVKKFFTHCEKRRRLEKDSGNFSHHRERKLEKKTEKHHSTKIERLEKLDSKTRVLLEERRKLLEKKRHLKQRLDKSHTVQSEKKKSKKRASFDHNEVFLNLLPNSEFTVSLNIKNVGTVPWDAPWLECFDFNGLHPKESRICLSRLMPMASEYVILKGKVCEYEGLHHFKCRLLDGQQKIAPDFTCWAKVKKSESVRKIPIEIINSKGSDDRKNGDSPGKLIDFKEEQFAATQKKIEENIKEIERSLQDINLLQLATSDLKNQ